MQITLLLAYILLKWILWLRFFLQNADSKGLSSTTFTPSSKLPNSQNNGHYAVQGHSRSPILVPIESDFLLVNNTNLYPISHRLFQLLVKISLLRGVSSLHTPSG